MPLALELDEHIRELIDLIQPKVANYVELGQALSLHCQRRVQRPDSCIALQSHMTAPARINKPGPTFVFDTKPRGKQVWPVGKAVRIVRERQHTD
ncbi:hypothetical protein D9M71_482900 [compost metagenome]